MIYLHLGHLSASVKISKTEPKQTPKTHLRQNLLLLQTCYNSLFLPRCRGKSETFSSCGKQVLHVREHQRYYQRQQYFLPRHSTLEFTKHFCIGCFTFISNNPERVVRQGLLFHLQVKKLRFVLVRMWSNWNSHIYLGMPNDTDTAQHFPKQYSIYPREMKTYIYRLENVLVT